MEVDPRDALVEISGEYGGERASGSVTYSVPSRFLADRGSIAVRVSKAGFMAKQMALQRESNSGETVAIIAGGALISLLFVGAAWSGIVGPTAYFQPITTLIILPFVIWNRIAYQDEIQVRLDPVQPR